jgi:acetyl-CoA carboxylase biotin carboxyl carrier protein
MKDDTILAIIEKFAEGKIAGLEIEDDALKLSLVRDAMQPSGRNSAYPLDARIAAADDAAAESEKPAPHGTDAPGTDTSAASLSAVYETITSPIVGTFYAAPAPDAPPFVKAGDRVKTGDALCILEAMKMMNRLEAEFDCEIVNIKAKSGELVEFGQALFEVKRV